MNVFPILLVLSSIWLSAEQSSNGTDFEPDYYDEDFDNVTLPLSSCDVKNGTILQPIDHEDENSSKWRQRYMVNVKYGKISSRPPVAFLLVHEHAKFFHIDICDERLPVVIWARKFGANLFMMEHRFYGPKEFSPIELEEHSSYEFLTANQTLADIYVFMAKMEEQFYGNRTARWILFGKSYGGTLAAWFNVKYPNRAAGIVASSAPMNFHPDHYEHMWMIERIFFTHSDRCVWEISDMFKEIAEMFYNGTYGRTNLQRRLRLCTPFIETELEQQGQVMFMDLISLFEKMAMYENKSVFHTFCQNIGRTFIDRFAVIRLYNNLLWRRPCFRNHIAMKRSSITGPEESWIWEKCNGFGLFPTTSGGSIMFESTIPLNFHIELCRLLFDMNYSIDHLVNQQRKLRETFGIPKHYKGSNTIFTHGEYDIYKFVAFPEEYADEERAIRVIEIEDALHTYDLLNVVEYNSSSVKSARNAIFKQLKVWLDYKSSSTAMTDVLTWLFCVLFSFYVCG